MKIKSGFKLRTVMGEPVIVAEGANQINFNKLISLNESAAFLWEQVEGKAFTVESLADLLTANYEVDRKTALADAADIAAKWLEHGLAEE